MKHPSIGFLIVEWYDCMRHKTGLGSTSKDFKLALSKLF